MRFEDKVVIVTGASSGIGEELPGNSWMRALWLWDAALSLRCILRAAGAIYVQANLTEFAQARMWWRKQ